MLVPLHTHVYIHPMKYVGSRISTWCLSVRDEKSYHYLPCTVRYYTILIIIIDFCVGVILRSRYIERSAFFEKAEKYLSKDYCLFLAMMTSQSGRTTDGNV